MRTLTRRQHALLIIGFALAASSLPAQTLQHKLILDHAIRPVEGSDAVLGNVTSIALAEDGTVYVAENKPARVTRYDHSGKFVGVFMREGAGPREARWPELAVHIDTLVVFDPSLLRLTVIAPSGAILLQRPVPVEARGFPIWVTRDGTMLIDAMDSAHGLNRSAVRITRSNRVDTIAWDIRFTDNQFPIWKTPNGIVKGGPFSAATEPAVDPDGFVVVGGTRWSKWFVVRERDTLRRVTLPDHSIPIAPRIRDSAWSAMLERLGDKAPPGSLDKKLVPTTLPAWVSLNIDPAGRWWIGRPGIDGKLASWDVLVNGKLSAQVPIPARSTGAIAYGRNGIAMLHEDENGVPWIGVYRW